MQSSPSSNSQGGFNLDRVHPGDCLLYRPETFTDWVVAVKTWCTKAIHCEIYLGNEQTLASRPGLGVAIYKFRESGLSCVRRPNVWLNQVHHLDLAWFYSTANGQKYDWLGLLCFTLAVKQGAKDRMFCSEFCVRQYREWGVELFNPECDADTISPAQFYQCGAMTTV